MERSLAAVDIPEIDQSIIDEYPPDYNQREVEENLDSEITAALNLPSEIYDTSAFNERERRDAK